VNSHKGKNKKETPVTKYNMKSTGQEELVEMFFNYPKHKKERPGQI